MLSTEIATPFHLVRLANQRRDEVRRRVQNQTLGHRGRKHDALYRARRLLTKADERLDDRGRTRLLGLLDAGDPHGEVRTAWHAKEVVRSIYEINDHALAVEFVDRLAGDLQDDSCPPEIHQLGRTVKRWHTQITNWHRARLSNGHTEAINNLVKRIKRIGFGFRRFRNYRIRALLYAGKPNWALLDTPHPRHDPMSPQNETLGHRGRKDDPLYRARRLLTKAHERLDERGDAKLRGLLRAGDPRGEV